MNSPRFEDYRFEIRPLPSEEGGGYLVSFPDLPGCASDGETYEEAIANARDAFTSWTAAYAEEGREIPAPNSEIKPAKFVLRVPREIHERLTIAATSDGVSVNTTVIAFIAEGLARREARAPASYFPLQPKEAAGSTFDVGAPASSGIASWPVLFIGTSFGSQSSWEDPAYHCHGMTKWGFVDANPKAFTPTWNRSCSFTSAAGAKPVEAPKRARHG